MSHYRINIRLNRMVEPYYRTVLVPLDITFYDLERVIQTVMDWSGFHMAYFSVGDGMAEIAHPKEVEQDGSFLRSDAEHLSDYRDFKIEYIYDMGDWWSHTVTVEKELEGDIPYPKMVNGKGRAELEDCGGPGCIEDVDPNPFNKITLETFDSLLERIKIGKTTKPKSTKVPYNAVYSLSLAAFLPKTVKLYLDPVSGKVYSDKKNEYFPKAESVSGFIELDSKTRYDIRKELKKELKAEDIVEGVDGPAIEGIDPMELYEEFHNDEKYLYMDSLFTAIEECAFKVLRHLKLKKYNETFCESEYREKWLPFELTLGRNLCPHCGKMLTDPCPDTGTEMLEYSSTKIYPIIMTCAGCGRDYSIVPTESKEELTYEGYRSSLKNLKASIEGFDWKKPTKARTDLAFTLYYTGNKQMAVEMAKTLIRSKEIYNQAVAATILYPEGMVEGEKIRYILDRSLGIVSLPLHIAAVMYSIWIKLGHLKKNGDVTYLFLEYKEPTLEYCMVADTMMSLLPRGDGFWKRLSETLRKESDEIEGREGWAASETYCRCMAMYDIRDPDYVRSFKTRGNKDLKDEVYTMSVYRQGILNLDTDTEEATKDLRVTISNVFARRHKDPAVQLRAAYAALLSHHLGTRYKGRDLIAQSARWMSLARDGGYLGKEDVDEYLGLFFKVALEDHSKAEISKILKRNGFGTEIPDNPGKFDPSVMKHVMAQYRIHPY